jgi:hypothetical protein
MIFVSFCDHWFLVSQRNQMIFQFFSDHWSLISRWTRMMFCTPWGPLISYFPVNSNDCLQAFVTTGPLCPSELEWCFVRHGDQWSLIFRWTRMIVCKLLWQLIQYLPVNSNCFLQALYTTVSKTNYTTDRFTSYLDFIYMLTMKESCALRIRMNVITLTSQ